MNDCMPSRIATSAEEIIDFSHRVSAIASALAIDTEEKLNPVLIPSCAKIAPPKSEGLARAYPPLFQTLNDSLCNINDSLEKIREILSRADL